MEDTLASYQGPQETVQQLIELALRGGGPDNITVIVADVLDIDDRRRSAVFRRETQAAWRAFDEKKAAEEREKAERAAEYQRQVDAMIERAHAEDRMPRPRVRFV